MFLDLRSNLVPQMFPGVARSLPFVATQRFSLRYGSKVGGGQAVRMGGGGLNDYDSSGS